MMVNLYKWIQGRTKTFSTIGLFALVGLSSVIQNFSTKNTQLTNLQDGIQTCFTRVHNTYTARLIGSGSQYLQESFVTNTEECFGEAVRVYENLAVGNSAILEDLNALSNDINWFHQKVTAAPKEGLFDGNPENVLLSNIGSKFEKLEIKKESVIEGLASAKVMVTGKKKTVGTFFYLFAALVPIFLFMDYLRRKTQEDTLSEVEESARKILREGNPKIEAIHELVYRALSGFGLKNLSKIYESFIVRGSLPTESEILASDKQTDEVGAPIMIKLGDRKSLQNDIEKAWTEKEVPKTKTKVAKKKPTIELEDSLSNVLDIVSSKIFTQGIKIDINTEPVNVFGEIEVIEQAFYHLLVNAIDNYNFEDPNKYLSINVRKLGATVLVDFFDSGREFSKEFLRQAKGLATGIVQHTELAIAQSLIEDSYGKISFENVANEDGVQVGRKIQVVLEATSSQEKSIPKRRLSRVEKSTKKEFLKALKENNRA